MKIRICILAALSLVLTVTSAFAQIIYENGPLNGEVNAWQINEGHIVSNSITCCRVDSSGSGGLADVMAGFDFAVWALPGDKPLTVDWTLTSTANGGIVYGGGTANLISVFQTVNKYGYDVDEEETAGLSTTISLGPGTYWLNLQNATTSDGAALYWDENSGVGCMSQGCPSTAFASGVMGTIPSESFTIQGSTPELGSGVLLGSGMLVLAGAMRRKLKF